MMAIVAPETADSLVRWEHWKSRYEGSSRRSARRARIVAFLVFAAILANVLVQLLARRA